MKFSVAITLFLTSLVCKSTTINNPFLTGGELLKINGYSLLSYNKHDSLGNLTSSGNVRVTLISQEDFHGEEVKILKLNTSETPIGGTPIANEMFEVYIDDDFAFNNTVSSFKYSSSILNRSAGKPPKSRYVSVGQTWRNISYRTGFSEVYGSQGQLITLPIRVVIESESTIIGIENINTLWGAKEVIVVETQKLIQSGNQEWVDGLYNYKNTYLDTQQVKKDYYLKGVGVYKTVITTSASSYATEESSTISNYSQTFTYPSPETKETLIYEYSTRNLSPTDFSEVTLPSSNSGSMNSPQVTNISYSQRIDQNGSRTKLVDIHYDLDGNRSMYVEFFFSYDGGLSYPVICTGMSGDAGAGVQKGLSKKALWDVSADWDQKLNLHARIMIKATYGDQPTGLPSLGGSSVFQEPSE